MVIILDLFNPELLGLAVNTFRWLFSASSDSILAKRTMFIRTSELSLAINTDVDVLLDIPPSSFDSSGTAASNGDGSKDFSTGVVQPEW